MDFVEQLKSSIDIVDVVGQYVRLKRLGSGARYVGLCPFHTEKTPSFNVHGARQFYHCFGCGVSGDAIKFVMEIQQLSFYEALKQLAERYGIPMPKREYSDPETKLRAAILRMHEIAFEAFRRNLQSASGGEARAYLARRGVEPALIEEFGLGLSDRSGQGLTRIFAREGLPEDQQEASGLILKRQQGSGFFDRFRGRLMFPISDESGKVIAFGGRALDPGDEPKYLNSPETPIYRKSYVLYNLNRARAEIRKQDRAVLVEGYMDVIGVWSAGVRIPVATCGTALTAQQIRSLRRYSDKIVVNFDSDRAGVNAAERSIQMLLEEAMRVRVLELEGGKDPDEFVRQHGSEAYVKALEKAPGYFYWLADLARTRHDTRTAEGKIAALQFLTPAIQRVSDKLERATIASDLAGYLGVEAGLVLDHFRKTVTDRRDGAPAAARQPVNALERMLLHALIVSPEARRQVLPALKDMPAVQQFATRRLFTALFAVSEAHPDFPYAELEARVEENDKGMLAAIAFADEGVEENHVDQALSCLRQLEHAARESSKTALKARVREAERSGDYKAAFEYLQELRRLDSG